MSFTNTEIVTEAVAGRSARTGNGNMSTRNVDGYLSPWTGYLANGLARILNDRAESGDVTRVIYSYNTPIAWLDGTVWVIPFARYSITTRVKHQTHLYRLPNRVDIPVDVSADEYARVIAGDMRFTRSVPDGRAQLVGTVPGNAFGPQYAA